jgi:hypothetical protein
MRSIDIVKKSGEESPSIANSPHPFWVTLKSIKIILVLLLSKAGESGEHWARRLSLVFSNALGNSIVKSCPIVLEWCFKPLSEDVLTWKVSSILMDGEDIMGWSIWDTRSIFESTMEAISLSRKSLTLMVLRICGALQKQDLVDFGAW